MTLREQENFGTLYFEEAVYMGSLRNSLRHGIGVMVYKTNRVYEGEWVDDMREGKGYEKYTNGNVYYGEF